MKPKIVIWHSLFFFISAMQAQIINLQVSSPGSTDPNEVHAAIHPIVPNRIVAGANMNYIYRSIDSANTWTETNMSSTLGTLYGDPNLAYDANGDNLYCAHILATFGSIVIQRSTNEGLTWNNGISVGQNGSNSQDKPWICTEKYNAPTRNSLYLAWTDIKMIFFGPTLTRIRFTKSTDSSASWSTPVDIIPYDTLNSSDKDDYNLGTSLSTGPNGEIYLCWASGQGIKFCKSLDSGKTFSNPVVVGTQPNGGLDYAISGLIRYLALPAITTDHSISANSGNIYITWSDCRNGSTNSDIFFVRSSNGGASWTGATKVNTDITTAQQFMPAINADPITGNLYVMYYDRRLYTSGDKTDVFISRSVDGGNTFSDTRVTVTGFTPDVSKFMGDYNVIEASSGYVYPIWAMRDANGTSVWTSPMRDTGGVFSTIDELEGNKKEIDLSVYPNPAKDFIYFVTKNNLNAKMNIVIYDAFGRKLQSILADEKVLSLTISTLSQGLYFCRLEGKQGNSNTVRFVKGE